MSMQRNDPSEKLAIAQALDVIADYSLKFVKVGDDRVEWRADCSIKLKVTMEGQPRYQGETVTFRTVGYASAEVIKN